MAIIKKINGINDLTKEAYGFLDDDKLSNFIQLSINDIQVYIFNNHKMTLFPWSNHKKMNLITVDYHSDTCKAFRYYNCDTNDKKTANDISTLSLEIFENSIVDLKNDEHISVALNHGYISTVYTMIRNYSNNLAFDVSYFTYNEDKNFNDVVFDINNILNTDGSDFILDIDLDFFCCKENIFSNMKLVKKPSIVTIALEPHYTKERQSRYAYNKLHEEECYPKNNCKGIDCIYYNAKDENTDSLECCTYENYDCLIEMLNVLTKIL